tara:strand:- start:2357 stop:3715 length:1359 start_codon:yes stop_codon:yes gene_type:complete
MAEAVELVNDPIVAISTAPGSAAVGILRLSGPKDSLNPILQALLGLHEWRSLKPRQLHLRTLRNPDSGEIVDEALVVRFAAPNSYTGEDLVELHLHGNPVVMNRVQELICELGARLARPGEFTRRALVNGRMSLLQAEALDALIKAPDWSSVRVARRHLGGELLQRIADWRGKILPLAAALEALVDFPEEVEDAEIRALLRGLEPLAVEMEELVTTFAAGQRGSSLPVVVLRGPVNAGKSTLFNALLGHSRAIVSELAGTTRDIVSEQVQWSGVSLSLSDTAGLRVGGDQIEAEGMERAADLVGRSDLILEVRDGRAVLSAELEQDESHSAVILVATHADLLTEEQCGGLESRAFVTVSAPTGAGIGSLRDQIVALLAQNSTQGLVLQTQRQQAALQRAIKELQEAVILGDDEPVLAALALARSGEALEELAGAFTTEEVLDELFARFCIGK